MNTSEENSKSNSSILLEDYAYFDNDDEVWTTRRNLPHITQNNVIYFVTFRLHDSIPKDKAKDLEDRRKLWKIMHKEPYSKEDYKEYYRLFSDSIERLLNSGYGSSLLRIKENKEIVENTLKYFDRNKYILDEFIIMPNHVHVLIKPINDFALKEILHSWKSYSANMINKRMGLNGQLWMHESFDHIVRSEEALEFLREYIRNNPKKRYVV
jgi:REP element-mobilizing transposase RayT